MLAGQFDDCSLAQATCCFHECSHVVILVFPPFLSLPALTFDPPPSGSEMEVITDRAIRKLLRLPFFDNEFVSIVAEMEIDTVEKVVGCGSTSADEFEEAITLLAPAMLASSIPAGGDRLKVVAERMFMFGYLWTLVMASKDTFLASAAVTFGFGAADRRVANSRSQRQGPCGPKKGSSHAAPVNAPKDSKKDAAEITPLMELEIAQKSKWISRLEVIAEAAGHHAKINGSDQQSEEVLTVEESRKLKQLVLAKGSFRTLGTNVRHWERFISLQGPKNCPLSAGNRGGDQVLDLFRFSRMRSNRHSVGQERDQLDQAPAGHGRS